MFLGYQVGKVLKAITVSAAPPLVLFLVFTVLAMMLLPNTPPKVWYFFGAVAAALYLGEKWKGNL